MLRRAALFVLFAVLPGLAAAEGWSLAASGAEFRRIDDRESFVRIVEQGTLSRFGITLRVVPDGRIEGRAFGRDVTGQWDWRQGYFCRDLDWGSTELGQNCQEVRVSGRLVRFTSDQGKGRFADLRLE